MAATIDTTLSQLYTDVGNFIVATLGLAAGQLVQGYPNRVAMPPTGAGFVVMTVLRRTRLNTNIDSWDISNPSPTGTTQETHYQVALQIDCYGPTAEQWSAILCTLFRDEVACDALTVCQPLYADDPLRAPIVDAEEQYEDRWIVTAQLQYNPIVSTTQDFANTLALDLINVYEAYPP
jgi:hypothetical protein